MKTTKLKVIGVPEHFNLPVHLAKEEGAFEAVGVNVEWRDEPGGTGAMTRALREEETDLAILLTEGIVADIINGNPSRILQQYVSSPLIWGIFTGVDSTLQKLEDIYENKYAISRYGSGSHLMAYVDAQLRGWDCEQLQFEVVGNFNGALEAFKKNEAQTLFWETYTTQPWVDSGELRRLGERRTPWPCFVIAATNNALENKQEAIINFLKVIRSAGRRFKKRLNVVELIANRYHLKVNDAEDWLSKTTWATDNKMSGMMLQHISRTLQELGITKETASPEMLVAEVCDLV